MKKTYVPIICLLIACAPADRLDTAADTAADEAAIRDVISRTAAANNAADTLGWVSLFEDGAVYMPPGSPEVTTREGLLGMAAAGFGPYAASIEMTVLEIVITGDWAFARSRVDGTVTPRTGGDAIPVDVKQIAIYHRQSDGDWKIARLIINGNT